MLFLGKILKNLVGILMFVVLLAPYLAHAAIVNDLVPTRNTDIEDFIRSNDEFASALVVDVSTQKVLYEYESTKRWTAASLTKLMGALVFLDSKPSWNRIVAMSVKDEVGGGRLRVSDGATLTIQDILFSSIVGSANNAATAMARISKRSMEDFVSSMNKKASILGCTSTEFHDASGMDPANMTTAEDMVKIALAAFSKNEIRRAATTSVYNFKIRNQGILKTIYNTNQLLTDDSNGLYVTGGKTGFLYESKHNLVVRLRPNAKEKQKELIVVVFGADSKAELFDISARLAQWSWKAYDWSSPKLAKVYEPKKP